MRNDQEREDYLRTVEQNALTDMAIQGFIDEEGRVPKVKEVQDVLADEDIPDRIIDSCLMMFAMGWQDTRTPDERLDAAKAMHDESDRETEPLIPIVREMVDELGRMPTMQELDDHLTSKNLPDNPYASSAWVKVYREQLADADDLAEDDALAEDGDEPAEA